MMRRFEIHRNVCFVGEGVQFEGDDALVVTNVQTGPYHRVTRRTLGDLEDWLSRTDGVLVWVDPPIEEQKAAIKASWPLDFY